MLKLQIEIKNISNNFINRKKQYLKKVSKEFYQDFLIENVVFIEIDENLIEKIEKDITLKIIKENKINLF